MASSAFEHPDSGSTRPSYRLAEVLAGLSLAQDLGTGHPVEHVLRTCCVGMQIAEELRLPPIQRAELYYTQLLMHSGCTADAADYAALLMGDEVTARADFALVDPNSLQSMLGWLWRNVAPDAPLARRLGRIAFVLSRGPAGFMAGFQAICEVGARIAARLGLPEPVHQALYNLWESWNGKGPRGLRGDAIPLYARIATTAFVLDSFASARGPEAATQAVLAGRGTILDPAVVDALLAAAGRPDFWRFQGDVALWPRVLDLEPDSPYRFVGEERIDAITCAFADFTDLKAPSLTGHSQGTAELAEMIARRMALCATDVADVRRAGLLHDLGHVTVPVQILTASRALSPAEEERIRLHPYYSERILLRVPIFNRVAAIAGAHHERMDGQGYYRGLAGDAIPLGAQILAVADRYEELASGRPGQGGTAAEALAIMRGEVGGRLAAGPFDALLEELGGRAAKPARHRERPAGLTDREVEVLVLVARGASNREIANQLVISEKTAGHHLEHIYNKIGVSSRAAAVFYAMQHRLIS